MSKSTGPILAAGGITLVNHVIVQGATLETDLKTVAGTLIAAVTLFGLEQVAPDVAVGLAWLALIGVIFVRTDPKVLTPAESFAAWYQKNAT